MRVFLALLVFAGLALPAHADRPPLPRDPFQKPASVQPQAIPVQPVHPVRPVHPHPISQDPSDKHVAVVPAERLDAALMGVVNGQKRVALVVQHNVVLTVHEGDHIGSARVTAIHADRVELQNGADHIVMLLHPAPDQKQNLPCAQVIS